MTSDDPLFPSTFTLNNGVQMPSVGLGTYRIRNGELLKNVVDYALDAGYRMFDTAAVYGNEIHLKNALDHLLPKHGLTREEIFITTKLSPADHGNADVVANAYRRSLDNLGLDYIDLYLVHFPGSAKIPAEDFRNTKLRDATWAGMTKLYDDGLVNTIGVSNFTIRHLKDIMNSNHGVIPAVNQVEWHPYYHQNDLLKFCKENDILLEAYCSLGGTSASNNDLLLDPVVKKIAKKHEATCAQVLLVWSLQQDIAIIPKSTDPNRIKENITYNFKLTNEEMKALDGLGERNIKYAWDPNIVA
ncbi:unnamed protein product [Diatraea saccharalis]|uniref:NADP-dependent oxidoreductase domain-containing protein n=1 Tax=Diatraea saccharalis TaxID=40085 RepID=A0A9N9QSU7_9NEOP|nr:unnamed protein product [Diatraea saccharalis]